MVEGAIENCPTRLEENAALIEDACEDYLENEVPLGTPLALYLNTASADDINNECINGTNCTLAFVLTLVDGFAEFTATGDSADLIALIGPLVENCY
jgi:hypothetical protein